MSKTIRIATALAAVAAPLLLAAPANAAPTGPSVAFHGGCKHWAITLRAGTSSTAFDVLNGKLVSRVVPAGQSSTVHGHFKHRNYPHFAMVYADGAGLAGHTYWCGHKH